MTAIRRVAWVVEARPMTGGEFSPVAAWWTRALARLDLKERREHEFVRYLLSEETAPPMREFRAIEYRPLDCWGGTALRYKHRKDDR